MAVTWSQQIDLARLRQILASRNGPVVRDLLRRGLLVESQAKRNLAGIGGPKRIDTGRLRASIFTAVIDRNGAPAVVVATNVRYARWVHDGTGIYGPHGALIRPRTRKYLRFRPQGAGKYVYAKTVKGMRPNPFLRNALAAAHG